MKLFYTLIFFFFIAISLDSKDYKYPFQDGVPLSEYKQRRDLILNNLSDNTALLSFSADFYNEPSFTQSFRQNSNFFYLTGLTEQNLILLLTPKGVKSLGRVRKEFLFLDEADENYINWHGPQLTYKAARNEFLFEKAESISDFKDVLGAVLPGIDTLIISGKTPGLDNAGSTNIIPPVLDEILRDFSNIYIIYEYDYLNKLRGIKSEAEIRVMQKACDITITAFGETIRYIAANPSPILAESDVEATMEYHFSLGGAQGPGYNSIVGAGANSCYYHYTRNDGVARTGDLLLMDCGASYMGYTADVTRTVPVSGKFSPEQKILYNIVLHAQQKGIDAAQPGNQFMAPHLAASAYISEKLLELGIIKELNESTRYFSHGVSHYLGIDVHDIGSYSDLQPGNIITVEPGIYIPAGSHCNEKWWDIGIRIEDDILITKDGNINLTQGLIKTIEEIEAFMNK